MDNMIKSDKKRVTMIDPPSGWRYGFPMPFVDSNGNRPTDIKKWLLDNGYPQAEIDSLNGRIIARFWEADEQ